MMKAWGINAQGIIAVLVVVMFGLFMFILIFHPMDPTAFEVIKDVLLVFSGVLTAKFGTVVDFYMGTSSGSKTANEALRQIATAGMPPSPPPPPPLPPVG